MFLASSNRKRGACGEVVAPLFILYIYIFFYLAGFFGARRTGRTAGGQTHGIVGGGLNDDTHGILLFNL